MQTRSLKYISEAIGGVILQGDPRLEVGDVVTDSRVLKKGDLFLALSGEKVDGHAFVPQAFEKGAIAVVVHERPTGPVAGGVILVADTRKALGQLGAVYRNDFDLPIVAIGGANGKTSTKELVASVLAQKGPTLRSEASFNNDLGVPMTLLRLEPAHCAAVVEVGTNHPGELAPLLLMIRPKFGVITNIGREHLEFFIDLAGVAQEEGAMAEALPAGGVLLLNGDSPEMGQIIRRSKAKILKIGSGPGNDWRCRNVRLEQDGTVFTVEARDRAYSGDYRIGLIGRHQAVNALFAIALGREFGLNKSEVQTGLAACAGAKMRMQIHKLSDWVVLDDAYNANPDSVGAALETLHDYPGGPGRVAVLGEMGELGLASGPEHRGIGVKAGAHGVKTLVVSGRFASEVAAGAEGAGVDNIHVCADVNEVLEVITPLVQQGSGVILVKASRAARFERVVEGLDKAIRMGAREAA